MMLAKYGRPPVYNFVTKMQRLMAGAEDDDAFSADWLYRRTPARAIIVIIKMTSAQPSVERYQHGASLVASSQRAQFRHAVEQARRFALAPLLKLGEIERMRRREEYPAEASEAG